MARIGCGSDIKERRTCQGDTAKGFPVILSESEPIVEVYFSAPQNWQKKCANCDDKFANVHQFCYEIADLLRKYDICRCLLVTCEI